MGPALREGGFPTIIAASLWTASTATCPPQPRTTPWAAPPTSGGRRTALCGSCPSRSQIQQLPPQHLPNRQQSPSKTKSSLTLAGSLKGPWPWFWTQSPRRGAGTTSCCFPPTPLTRASTWWTSGTCSSLIQSHRSTWKMLSATLKFPLSSRGAGAPLQPLLPGHSPLPG